MLETYKDLKHARRYRYMAAVRNAAWFVRLQRYGAMALVLAFLLIMGACAGDGEGLDEQGNPIVDIDDPPPEEPMPPPMPPDEPMPPEEPMPPDEPMPPEMPPDEPMPPEMPMSLTFTEIQETIFVPFCTCHAGANPPLGLVLNTDATYDQLVDELSSQRPMLMRVEPGNPDNSYLIHKLEGGPNIIGAQMPRGGPPLPQETIDEVRAWIIDGALNN